MWVDVYEKTQAGHIFRLFGRDLPTGGNDELMEIYGEFCSGMHDGDYIDSEVLGYSKERDYDTGGVKLYIKTSSWR